MWDGESKARRGTIMRRRRASAERCTNYRLREGAVTGDLTRPRCSCPTVTVRSSRGVRRGRCVVGPSGGGAQRLRMRFQCLARGRSQTSLVGLTERLRKDTSAVTVRSSRGECRPAPGLWLRAQWRPSTRRSASLAPPWDGDTEPRSDPWLSERYGRIAWYVRNSRLMIVCRYPVCGRSCRRDGWL